MSDYEKLLKRGMESIPKKVTEKTRFEMPVAQVMKSGARTFINNFTEIAKTLRREPGHLLKFILKELATKGELKGSRLEVLGNFSEEAVNKKIELYAKSYVFCPECGKPDTKIVRQDDFSFLKCEACGARHPVAKV